MLLGLFFFELLFLILVILMILSIIPSFSSVISCDQLLGSFISSRLAFSFLIITPTLIFPELWNHLLRLVIPCKLLIHVAIVVGL